MMCMHAVYTCCVYICCEVVQVMLGEPNCVDRGSWLLLAHWMAAAGAAAQCWRSAAGSAALPWQLMAAGPHPHCVVVTSRAISAAHVPAFWPPPSPSPQAPSHGGPLAGAGAACHATSSSSAGAAVAVGACERHVLQRVGRRCSVPHCLRALVLRDDLRGAGVWGALAVAVVLAGCSTAGDSEDEGAVGCWVSGRVVRG